MFWFNKKKSSELGFKLDYPQISIVPQMPSVIASLKSSNTPYKVVADGYITHLTAKPLTVIFLLFLEFILHLRLLIL